MIVSDLHDSHNTIKRDEKRCKWESAMKLPALGSAVVYVCACGTSAFAQTTTQNGSIDADTTAAAAEQPASEDGDIIVTALKQSTTLQKTPAAISVVGGEELVQRSITDIRAIGD